MEEVGFGLTGMACNDEVRFGLTRIEMAEVSIGQTGRAWNGGS
jgi:hypothetical protein